MIQGEKLKQNRCFYRKMARKLMFGLALILAPLYAEAAGLYLVGLGPGDPDLATVRAIKHLESADIIYTMSPDIRERFASHLKSKEVRELSEQSISRYNARKAKNRSGDGKDAAILEGEKNRRSLIQEVRHLLGAGKQVVFADSGDPLIYGPWVWILQEFSDLNPEVVPGVSSFNAGLAALKRDGTWASRTHSIILTTDRPHSQDSLESLAAHQCSLVIFTHRTNFADILRKLKTQYPPETPISIVFYAGYKGKQSIVSGDLNDIQSKIKPETLPLEHILFIGDFLTYDINKN